MEANHDIHNRSRNRKQKQERHPRWNQNTQQKWPNNHATKCNTQNNAGHEQQLTKSLRELCISRQLIEDSTGIQKRRRVMRDLDTMLCAWSESLLPGSSSYIENIISPNSDETAAPSLLSFGSYRLGVHTPDGDVDCLVLAPPHVTRDDFFGSWVDILRGEERVAELHPVSSAFTPVIKFEMDEVKIDLIFARVNNTKWLTEQRMKMALSAVALVDDEGKQEERIEMSVDDSVLIGLDETSVRSVNGVRVAQVLSDILDGNLAQVDHFRLTLRAVKEWARVNGLYSNVLGFLGGVNWAILVCWVCKRNPDASASKLLQLFFRTFANWKWPGPVFLSSKQKHPPKGVKQLPIWDPNENYRDATHLMPIITPCYPPMNSSSNVGEPQLRRLRDELWRARKLSDEILSGTKAWGVLFEGNEFFKQHANYLQVNIIGTNEDEFRSWFGLCESRMRLLIVGMESPNVGVRAYPFAKFFHRREEGYASYFFIGLRFPPGAERVNLEPLVADFLSTVNNWEGRSLGMDLTIHLVAKNNLPSFVFKDSSDVTNDAETPSKPTNQQHDATDENASEEQADTPHPCHSPWLSHIVE
mmetsp:Transcript_17637/g.31895  ORF Transcript_17637/g.31895 Transcript_17637/m.31895 type:complete len:586 (-) Transcript_17637:431-2188(-)